MCPTEDPYQRLGVTPGASPDAIRRAYRERAKQAHPDAGGSAAEMAALAGAYRAVTRQAPGVRIVRAPRRAPRWYRPAVRYSAEAERFCLATYGPQVRLLELALERLAYEPTQVVGARLALEQAGRRLVGADWPEELWEARAHLVGALRGLSDALVDWEEDVAVGRRALKRARWGLRQVAGLLPG